MIRRRILKFFCLLALGLTLFDTAVDTFACETSEVGVECHTCSCGTHVAPPVTAQIAVVVPEVARVDYKPSFYAHLVPTAIFHPPPRLAA